MRCTPVSYTLKMHAYEMYAHVVYPYEITPVRCTLVEVPAGKVYVRKIHAHEVHAYWMPVRHTPIRYLFMRCMFMKLGTWDPLCGDHSAPKQEMMDSSVLASALWGVDTRGLQRGAVGDGAWRSWDAAQEIFSVSWVRSEVFGFATSGPPSRWAKIEASRCSPDANVGCLIGHRERVRKDERCAFPKSEMVLHGNPTFQFVSRRGSQ
jgi:hypothetical protein